jgi:hypothetical protein
MEHRTCSSIAFVGRQEGMGAEKAGRSKGESKSGMTPT